MINNLLIFLKILPLNMIGCSILIGFEYFTTFRKQTDSQFHQSERYSFVIVLKDCNMCAVSIEH